MDFLDKPIFNTDLSGGAVLELSDSQREELYDPIDYRLRQLSYSGRLTLNSCPKKYQLRKITGVPARVLTNDEKITFDVGHIIGEAIQNIFIGKTKEEIYISAFLRWSVGLFDTDTKGYKKNFFGCLLAIDKLIHIRNEVFKDYEVLIFNGKPAVELSFKVSLPNNFNYRGFVDLVLKHKVTGKIAIFELKTSGATSHNPTKYVNSAQGIGYSVVLDAIAPEIMDYTVYYCELLTQYNTFHITPFQKTYLQRALWIKELMLDVDMMIMYEAAGVYPKRGESCTAFGRDCDFLNGCNLSVDSLIVPLTPEHLDKTDYTINLTLADLVQHQLNKVTTHDETI